MKKEQKNTKKKKENKAIDGVLFFIVLLTTCLLISLSFFAILITYDFFKNAPPYALIVDVWKFILPASEVFVIYILGYILIVLFIRLVKNAKVKIFWNKKEKLFFFIAVLVFIIYSIYFSWLSILRNKELKACKKANGCGTSWEQMCDSLPPGMSNECYACRGAEKNDPLICEKAGVFRNYSYRDDCYFGLALKNKDLKTCETIKDDKIRSDCEKAIKE